jgi:alpha-galactosidase
MAINIIGQTWILETEHTGYVFGINPQGILAHGYWGKRLPNLTDYPSPPVMDKWASFNDAVHLTPEEYPTICGMKFTQPAIAMCFSDGVRDFRIKFESSEQISGDNPEICLNFCEEQYPVRLSLHYRLYEAEDLIERWVSVTNLGVEPIEVSRIFSACWNFPSGDHYRLSHLTGRWNDEMNLHRERLTPGVKVLESRRLTTSHHHNPWFAIDEGEATEDYGRVWFGALAWSGNWKIEAEVTDFNSTRIHMGINDWDFNWRMKRGEILTTPHALAGFTPNGFSDGSRKIHNHIREHLLPHRRSIHKVLYNSWEATGFDVNVTSQTKLAEIAAEIGVELFVVDDGWFHGRTDDRSGLGDWWPDEKKFPHGLTPLIKKVNELGMEFGLWIEPEMINPDSDLYRAHPDWVIHFPGRSRTESRNQLILNLARNDVRNHVFTMLDNLLANNNIRFIKWDMNRNVSEPGWPDAPGDPREIWVRYVEGLYELWGKLQSKYPQVTWQSCSGGGGRADLGVLRFADQIWVSDNTNACSRLNIQQGFSQIFPAITMESWVTDSERAFLPLEFRFHVSMCGVLGVGADLTRWTAEERKVASACIAEYKKIREIVQLGDQYRLTTASENGFHAIQYMSRDKHKGVIFVFRPYIPEPVNLPSIYPRGLEQNSNYRMSIDPHTRSGIAWMETGLLFKLENYQSTICYFTQIE